MARSCDTTDNCKSYLRISCRAEITRKSRINHPRSHILSPQTEHGMSTPFIPLPQEYAQRTGPAATPETAYWNAFKVCFRSTRHILHVEPCTCSQYPVVVKEYGAITSIAFSPVAPYDYAVTSSARVCRFEFKCAMDSVLDRLQVQIYNSITNKSRRTISRFTGVAYGALTIATHV